MAGVVLNANALLINGTWGLNGEVQERGKFPRLISKYHLLSENLEEGAASIRNFLVDNPNLYPTFNVNVANIQNALRENTYIIITMNAISLAADRQGPRWSKKEWNDGFTGNVTVNPVMCSKDHIFERDRLQFWINTRGNICPFINRSNVTHEINDDPTNLLIEEGIKGEIEEARNEADRVEVLVEAAERQQRLLRLANLPTMPAPMLHNRIQVGGDAAKILIKLGGLGLEVAARETVKIITKQAAVNGVKYATKYIPFVSLGVGILFAAYRIYLGVKTRDKSQFVKAALEVISGAAAMAPGVGIIASVALDVGIAGHDIYQLTKVQKKQLVQELPSAYQELGLNIDDEPSKEEVDNQYRAIAREIHPDHEDPLGEEAQRLANISLVHLNLCKETIYRARRWAV